MRGSSCRTLLQIACLAAAVVGSIGTEQYAAHTLVLGDDLSLATTHSQFLSQLESRGHKVTLSKADNASISLTHYGEYVYDNVIIFSPQVEEFGGALDVAEFMSFVDSGRNLMVALSPASSSNLRAIASECGVIADAPGAYVQDHFKSDGADDGSHTLVTSVKLSESTLVVGEGKEPILFRGTGLKANPSSTLVFPALSGHCTTYSALPDRPLTGDSMPPGKQTLLVAAMQSKNNARCTVSGSLELFSDEYYNAQLSSGGKSGNRNFAASISAWTVGETGIVKMLELSYGVEGSSEKNPKVVRVGDEIKLSAVIAEGVGTQWAAYLGGNVQLELSMMEPYVRTNLKSEGKGIYTAAVRVPDVHGVYTMKLRVGRPGYSHIEEQVQVTVRPLRHDEHERFLVSAYPYYASALSMMGATLAVALVVLYGEPDKSKKA